MCLYYVLHTLLGNINKKNNLHINWADIYGTYTVSALSQVPGLHPKQDKLVLCEGSEQGNWVGKESRMHGNNATRVRSPTSLIEGSGLRQQEEGSEDKRKSEKAEKMKLSSIFTEEFWHQ